MPTIQPGSDPVARQDMVGGSRYGPFANGPYMKDTGGGGETHLASVSARW